ncbi:unnamed protein product [Mycetohabitans rhizoxinica HKI 454]|uniref:Uncharacterized protein n=1 Tax=Mycetohabitans rhizoxinica (strain DSM 19002 / CIP 109453 / HKI 454) TaxID=882378 RepID=E5AT51_MYCRK|nr:unnamed protein product [Mycetohabitans rhizoxinica HKI 454]
MRQHARKKFLSQCAGEHCRWMVLFHYHKIVLQRN